MARQHAGMTVISKVHKEVVNMRTAGAASKCSAGNAIRILIRQKSLKPLFCTPLIETASSATCLVTRFRLDFSNPVSYTHLTLPTKRIV